MRKFIGIDFMTESVTDEATLCKFRNLLEANGLNKLFFDAINRAWLLVSSRFSPQHEIVPRDLETSQDFSELYYLMRVHPPLDLTLTTPLKNTADAS